MKQQIILIGVTLLLLASCGRQQQAKTLVKDFMAQQGRGEVSYIGFSSLDSTRAIGDSLITVLRQRAPQGIRYQERTGVSLLFLRAQYLDGQDTCSATFYLDKDLTGIVAYKENK